MITIRLHLAVDDEWVPADLVLASDDMPINLHACSLSIVIDGAERSLGQWNLGRVDLITAQADDCVRRLRRGKRALLRSAVLGSPGVPYHLFEPPNDEGAPALFSRFVIEDDDVNGWLPLPNWGVEDPEDLFDWVDEHLDELLEPEVDPPESRPKLIRLPVPVGQLIEQLELLAETGRAVLGGDPDVGWDD